MLVSRGPVTVNAARIGEPTLTDPPPVTAPDVHKRDAALFTAALSDQPLPSLEPPAGSGRRGSQWNRSSRTWLPARPFSWRTSSGAPAIGASIVRTGENAGSGSSGQTPAASAPASGVPVGPAVTPEGAAAAAAAAGVPGAQNQAAWRRLLRPTTNLYLPSKSPRMLRPNQRRAQCSTSADRHRRRRHQREMKKKTPAPKYDASEESSLPANTRKRRASTNSTRFRA